MGRTNQYSRAPHKNGYPVFFLPRPDRRDQGFEELSLWISTRDREHSGCAGLLVRLTSNRFGKVLCSVTEETERLEPRHGEGWIGWLRASCVSKENAVRWFPAECGRIDCQATLEAIVWTIIDDLAAEGVFISRHGDMYY